MADETMTDEEKNDLIHRYAQDSVDNMDMDAMYHAIYEHISERMSAMSVEDVLAEIKELNPDILENENA